MREKRKEAIQDEIDKLWHIYDRDRSGALDAEEARECVKDILGELGLLDCYSDHNFEQLFYQLDKNQDDVVDQNEIVTFIEALLNQEEEKYGLSKPGINILELVDQKNFSESEEIDDSSENLGM